MTGTPDYLFADVYQITPDFFSSLGVDTVLCDIDNTLVTYDDPEPTPELRVWLDGMTAAGIAFIFISNNHPQRVERFNQPLGFAYLANAQKPLTGKIKKLLGGLGADLSRVAVLGDQILTDSLTAVMLGVISVNVPPIKDRTGLFFRFKRMCERPFMRAYLKKHPESEALCHFWCAKTGNRPFSGKRKN